jgi:LysM repeat protein
MIKLLIIAFSLLNPQTPKDSVGLETIKGKVFVVHKVGERETLYGISKRYGSTVDEVLKYNPSADGGLEIGQILKVPYTARPVVRTNTSGRGIIHVVAEKETLFSISKAYNVTVDELKQWNNLTSNALSLGQELTVKKRNTNVAPTNTPTASVPVKSKTGVHTVGAKETMFSISKLYGITLQQLRTWNNLQVNELSVGQVLYVAEPEKSIQPVTQPQNNTSVSPTTPTVVKQADPEPVRVKDVVRPPVTRETITITEAVKGSDEILESGLAELIEGTDGNRKYLALHRTAPIGTILKVKNEMNNREVFVRVMGKLQETALTDKLIIRVSKSAYDRLGAIDQKFRVQVTYYK